MSEEAWDLRFVPEIPPLLIQAAKDATLVLFVGAGVSRLMGAPTWKQLADRALEHLARDEALTFAELDQLRGLHPKRQLTIAQQIAETKSLDLDLPAHLEPMQPPRSQIYEHLISIGCSFVTTNYDAFLDGRSTRGPISSKVGPPTSAVAKEKRLICHPRDFNANLLAEPGNVVHLHGSSEEPETMVVTTPDYLRHYDRDEVRHFLEALFNQYTVLFIGCSLEEEEVLEHILRKGRARGGRRPSRFMLAGYFTHQENTFTHLRRYYEESFQISLIPFNRDKRDYDQLEEVMEHWSSKLPVGEPLLANALARVLEAARE